MSTFAISRSTLNRRRVIFVDDEPFALEALQRVFEPMRNEWHMEFVTSGPAALERLDQLHFDAVVTDLKMPGMNGAELLEQVMRRHPAACRVILSAQADEDLVFQSVHTAHQFISKTAEPKALLRKVRKLVLLRQSKLPLDIVELICGLERLPTVPAVYAELVESLSDPETDLVTMSEIISRDAATGAKVLQLANSAFFGLRGEVSSILEAVTFLGVETVRYLVLMVGVCEQFRSVRFQPGFIENVWSHSVETAKICRILAETENASLTMSEEAFVAGLLHDLGKLVLAENRTAEYLRIVEQAHEERRPLWQVEREVLKATHGQIGAYLLDLWGLPENVTRAVELHDDPSAEKTPALGALAIVHVANYLEHDISVGAEAAGCDLNLEFLEAANLTDRLPIWHEVAGRAFAGGALV
jgi:putative nucleotidyltransferase with HDIG domain